MHVHLRLRLFEALELRPDPAAIPAPSDGRWPGSRRCCADGELREGSLLDRWLAYRAAALAPLARAWLSALGVEPATSGEAPNQGQLTQILDIVRGMAVGLEAVRVDRGDRRDVATAACRRTRGPDANQQLREREESEAFANRKVYTELTPEILAEIPDDKLEQAVIDFIDHKVAGRQNHRRDDPGGAGARGSGRWTPPGGRRSR